MNIARSIMLNSSASDSISQSCIACDMTGDEEYRVFLEQVNKLVERRQAVTAVYLSVNSAIMGVIAFFFRDVRTHGWVQQLPVLALLLSGIVACDLWRRLIAQYSSAIGWWYERLRKLEDTLPICSRLLNHEYQALYVDRRGKLRLGITRYETRLTWLFTVLYVVFGLAISAGLIF